MGMRELISSEIVSNELRDISEESLIICNIKEKTFKIIGNITNDLNKNNNSEIVLSWQEGFNYIEGLKGKSYIKKWEKCLQKNKPLKFIVKIRCKDSLWIQIKIKPFINKTEGIYCYCGYIRNVTKEKELEELVKKLVSDDILTELPSNVFMKSVVNSYLEKCHEHKLRGALILININDFKKINDSFGYDKGDYLLEKLADKILKYVDEEDLVCRYSADEFIIFKPETDSIEAIEDFITTLQEALMEPFYIKSNTIYITVSIGVSIFPDNGENFDELHKNANIAMDDARINRRNGWRLFDDSISYEANKSYLIQEGLRTALINNEMYVVFQPKVFLETSLVTGFEALLRWNSRELGNIEPNKFISIAERTKEIIPIGKFVLEEVFIKIKQLLDEGNENFRIAVNFSDVQLTHGTVLNDLIELSNKYKVSLKYIEIEITESTLMESFKSNKHKLEAIKFLGVTIALDDFGTGYSSLNYLTKLPIDVLKIDRSFLVDLIKNRKNGCIVENIIKLSHELGMYVVAEGVEEKEQVEYLKKIYCDSVQGYYYSKPKKFDEIKSLLGKKIVVNI
ncbi:MAG: bifunctional diguanylate cyclase/phosphodiesterase [Clostridiales bacterium]|nr:bifunctional diguanylate cyclase/phosphodiesterase [Clostridiales bacterium]